MARVVALLGRASPAAPVTLTRAAPGAPPGVLTVDSHALAFSSALTEALHRVEAAWRRGTLADSESRDARQTLALIVLAPIALTIDELAKQVPSDVAARVPEQLVQRLRAEPVEQLAPIVESALRVNELNEEPIESDFEHLRRFGSLAGSIVSSA